YIVDNAGDSVAEAADGGSDTVRTTLASYTLGANIENLTNIGTAAFTGTGNALNNILSGGAGVDTLKGGTGDDTYVISTGDIVIENADEGTDTVQTALAAYTLAANVENLTYAGTAAFTGVGNGLDNVLKGGVAADKLIGAGGNDTLIGGAGADTMSGGIGDDIYVVDIATDLVIENANEGTDTVQTALVSYTLGTNVETLTYTGSASFTGTGNALANTITGGAGNDTLNGGAGADTLIGGAGSDTYIVDNAADSVTEAVAAGIDTVRTTLASYTLGSDVENLTYVGTAAFTGTGNALNNILTGGAGADTLDGKAGADILIGGAGNDTYIVDDLADVVTEGVNAGTDLVRTTLSSYTLGNNVENLTYTGSASFTGTGNALTNMITGGAGNDLLDGGAGNDILIGGAGNDIYVVDSTSEVVTEAVSAGTDEIRTALAGYTLGDNVENLTYTGSANFTGTGNALANTITGGAGNDILDGGAGADSLIGGAGDDTYIVDNAADSVTENADAGSDTVRTTLASYTLGSDVENLTYAGTSDFSGTGNSLDNLILGGSGTNTLTGGAGNDILIGGEAADFFVYSPNWGHDTIIDFMAIGTAHDTIRIDHSIFADWASLLAASSQSGSDTIVTADIDNTITLKNVAVSSLDSFDFLFA
ncbi:serralysin, partial [Rhizobium leguminosarum]